MTITVGDRLPEADLLRVGAEGPESVALHDLIGGKRAVVFGLPGAFTRTCSAAHVPSFIRTKDDFAGKGIDTIVCVAVNDPFVMDAWAKDTGAADAGLQMLGDADGGFTRAIGMSFDAPPVGFHGRSKRYAMIVDDGVVQVLHAEENPGVCDASGGEALLAEA